eukprot:4572-Heterococcus_DN1.PRE.2
MARKKAQKKQAQNTTQLPLRTPDLSVLLQRAETGDSATAVKAYQLYCYSPITMQIVVKSQAATVGCRNAAAAVAVASLYYQ